MTLVVIDINPNRSIVTQHFLQHFNSVPHEREPKRMLYAVIILGESGSSVVRRIDINAFYFARELMLQCLQCKKIVSKDKAIVEEVTFAHTLFSMVRLLAFFE